MLEAGSRLAWRVLRRVARVRSRPAGRAVGIERFSVFQGSIRLAGRVVAPGRVRALALHLPGGERLAVPFVQAGDLSVRFDAVLSAGAAGGVTGSEAAHAVLVGALEDGAEWRLEKLGDSGDDPVHGIIGRFAGALAERPAGLVLEVGSRARSGLTRRHLVPAGWGYSGFDILAGPNVDVVGDAHELSGFYPAESVDAVIAFSVLEHLLMPWKFVLELNRVLKPGAVGVFVTHQCWPLHDRPWDFWRFSDTAWTGLLNPATGYEIVEARLGEEAFVVAQRCNPITAFGEGARGALASAVLFRKIGGTSLSWPVGLREILASAYPAGETQVQA